MDVSFSANTWKVNEIQSIDTKFEEEFYASTPYNLSDFKNTSHPPVPIFKPVQNTPNNEDTCLKKQLIKKQHMSLSIFITYLYDFFHQMVHEIQKNISSFESKSKLPLQSNLKVQKASNDDEEEKQSDRRFLESQKHHRNQENQQLKKLKLKIYELDLCGLKNIPQKFIKYYNNNLLKKIIFQYLSKAQHNISLVEILLESNELLCFALSLITQSLLFRDQKITCFNQNENFYQEALTFLDHFDSLGLPQSSVIKEKQSNILPASSIQLQSKIKQKGNNLEENSEKLKFLNFALGEKEMKSRHAALKEEISEDNEKIYNLYLISQKPTVNKKRISSAGSQDSLPNKTKNMTGQQSTKYQSKAYIPPQSDQKLKLIKQQPKWLQYLACLRYFFRESPKK